MRLKARSRGQPWADGNLKGELVARVSPFATLNVFPAGFIGIEQWSVTYERSKG